MKGHVAIAALGVAAAVGAGAPSGARAAFLDEASWHNAVLALDASLRSSGRTVRYVPFSVRPILYEDGFGTFTQDSTEWVFAPYAWDNPHVGEWVPRRGGTFLTSEGALQGWLGCNTLYYPCFGATRVTLGFDGEVLGFGGSLTWWNAHTLPYRDEMQNVLPFFSATYDHIDMVFGEGNWPLGYGYRGFFGTIGSMTELELTYWHGSSPDDHAGVRFAGLMLLAVPVPEPPAVPLLAAAAALLGLAGAGRALSPAAGSR